MTCANLGAWNRSRRFFKCEEGSQSAEFVIWTPVFTMILALIANASLAFVNESRVMRIVQDANRALSVGRLTDTQETQDYIASRVQDLSPDINIQTSVSNGIVHTSLSLPMIDLMPIGGLGIRDLFADARMTVQSQQFIEF